MAKPKFTGYDRSQVEWYIEPEWCVESLAMAERFGPKIYDPACGRGTIPTVFERLGYEACGSDLIDRGYGYELHDFLEEPGRHLDATIVCNPPYNRGDGVVQFVNRSLDLGYQEAAFLVNESFIYSGSRHSFFQESPLRSVWFLSDRPSCPPGELLEAGKVEAKGGTTNYCWIVFQQGWTMRPTCGWLRRPDKLKR